MAGRAVPDARAALLAGWTLLPPVALVVVSFVQPVLVARCESSNEDGLERLMGDLKAALSASGVELPDEASAHH